MCTELYTIQFEINRSKKAMAFPLFNSIFRIVRKNKGIEEKETKINLRFKLISVVSMTKYTIIYFCLFLLLNIICVRQLCTSFATKTSKLNNN